MDYGYIKRVEQKKPRTCGVTMVIDKGLGPIAYQDLLTTSSDYIDFIKLGFGTLDLTPLNVVERKINLSKESQVHLYPGGTFFEVAYHANQVEEYFSWLATIGFTWVEISIGVIELTTDQRLRAIEAAKQKGFRVITEIGKKQAGSVIPIEQLITQYEQDLSVGAEYVIIEGRETGENIGIFNKQGDVDTSYVKAVNEAIDLQFCIWEAPKKEQQVCLMELLGENVNLGNIAPSDILSVEALRQGLRADTFSLWR